MSSLTMAIDRFLPGLLQQQSGAHSDAPGHMQDPMSDEHLVEAIVNRGSQHHFSTLLARYKDRVFHVALSVLGPGFGAQAEDVAQDIFIRVYQRLHTFRGDSKFSTWLHRLSINTAIDHRRKLQRQSTEPLDEHWLPESAIDHSGTGPDPAESRILINAVEHLPDTQRTMIHLFYWLDLKISEIANIMDCPEGTVKVYLARARKSLAGSVQELKND